MLIMLGLAAACGPSGRGHDGNGGGGDDGPDASTNPGGGSDNGGGGGSNSNSDGCSDAAKLVYVVDDDGRLSQFDPPTKTFTDLGTLSCPSGYGAQPFSMGIDRDAIAWVLYSNGELFRVETKNHLACTKAGWSPNTNGLKVFGMGFSTDAVGGTTDTLFIAGGSGVTSTKSTLAQLDMGTFQPVPRGTITGWPELTGTGNAELWGFFPSGNGARVVKIDKTNGAALQTYSLNSLAGDPTAWAFAFHGGDFWVFLKKDLEDETTVYQVSGMTGAITGSTLATGRSIVGAGVSTCAPVIY